ncbi:PREDICTED: papilin-like [Gekko japonicus]|uniref:Papilin-like n=1 Tax=Gekko japonicus TaxID=146911 RepID=A0ABM1LAH8_GEKJA|nr:PREDICTED: papilin-like [Gekko japonicus]
MHCAGLLLLVRLLTFWAELSPGSGQGTPVDKAGTCPALIQWPDQMCGRFCSTDRSCPGQEKCCRTRCAHECRLPSESIGGYCPKVTLPPNTSTICLARCSTDQSCRENGHPGKKCCSYGCELRCTEPVEEHPGVCPKNEVVQTLVPCNDTCRDDRNCPLRQKCCFTRCSLGCLDSVRSERCQLPPETGPCRQKLQRYYYNHEQKRCLTFVYGGCPGNGNNFETEKACQEACGKISPEVCKLPMDSGPCLAHMERYYYDRASRTCKKFVYGGCRGNGNRFSSKTECMMVCGNRGKG